MCGGGGGDKPYNPYEDDKWELYRTQFDTWAKDNVAAAKKGGNLSKLSNLDAWEPSRDKFGSDARASMEMQEMERQYLLDLGKTAIDKRFTKFDDKYFSDYRDDYTGYYNPQVTDQFNKTGDKLVATLADRGMLDSSVGNASRADLSKEYSTAKTNIANEALDASNKLRSSVEQSKSNLYSINEASADPMSVNAQAQGAATTLVAPPQYSPLGQIFASALTPFQNYVQASSSAPTRSYTSNYSTKGSGRVVQ
ncbi:hypothetical protein GGQ64_005340 [Rhizobium azooxidifex]|uniref:Uncharacterized protein n=1 Tax=Mycoplana azooxidifex TaxID=1636188 RepID=A0A7W6DBC8_9HYPH|nr:hypothetical protein [Mycoplana azooxidifex]MBB3980093.1 hypothetical protein [Mycoplana azooxidifex]